ncbi:MAG: hypothetical protein NVS4B8_23170 [Herpetosiphon sp.]
MSDKRILVVDDDAAIVEVFALILHEEGYNVISASNGEDGLRLAQQQQPDLILLDLMLPDMPGNIVAERLRCLPALSQTPIVVVSAAQNMSRIVKTMNIQAALAKPFELTSLLSLVEQHVAA